MQHPVQSGDRGRRNVADSGKSGSRYGQNGHPRYADSVAASTLRDVLVMIITSPEPVTRSRVADRLEISKPTVTKAVQALIGHGYLLDDSGRDAPLRMEKERCHVVGISLRPEDGRIGGVVMNLAGEVVEQRDRQIKRQDPSGVVEAIRRLVGDLNGAAKVGANVRGVGVAVGGWVVPKTGTVMMSENFDPTWWDVPLASLVQDATGLDCQIENDANSLALNEQWFGAGRGSSTFITVLLGDYGVGAGHIIDGRLRHSRGELGHTEIDKTGRRCRCLRRGCLETFTREAAEALTAAREDVLDRVEDAGDAVGRVLGEQLLSIDYERILICGERLANERAFRVAVGDAIRRRPWISDDLVGWHELSWRKLACGAGCTLLWELKFENHRHRLGHHELSNR